MRTRRTFSTVWSLIGFVVAACTACNPLPSRPMVPVVLDVRLPDIPLHTVQSQSLPAYPIHNDRGVLLGGIGSDLFHQPGAAADEFWAVTDRGPNAEVSVKDHKRSTLLVPDFTPTIVQLRVTSAGATPIRYIAIQTPDGDPVTGLPNLQANDPQFWDATGREKLAENQNGLDVEGLIRLANGEFWVAEEYGPSLVHLDATGHVIARFVPFGHELPDAAYPVIPALPAAYRFRKTNRGFEGLAISPDEHILYAALQSPLSLPSKAIGDTSRATRILAFDITTGTTVGDYVYELADARTFDPRPDISPSDMKLAALIALDATHLLVLERTDWHCVVTRFDITGATNLLGTQWEAATPDPALESVTTLETLGIVPGTKEIILDSSQIAGIPDKIEGMALVNGDTLVLSNDNDFAVGRVDASGANIPTGVPSRILEIALQTPLR